MWTNCRKHFQDLRHFSSDQIWVVIHHIYVLKFYYTDAGSVEFFDWKSAESSFSSCSTVQFYTISVDIISLVLYISGGMEATNILLRYQVLHRNALQVKWVSWTQRPSINWPSHLLAKWLVCKRAIAQHPDFLVPKHEIRNCLRLSISATFKISQILRALDSSL